MPVYCLPTFNNQSIFINENIQMKHVFYIDAFNNNNSWMLTNNIKIYTHS